MDTTLSCLDRASVTAIHITGRATEKQSNAYARYTEANTEGDSPYNSKVFGESVHAFEPA